MTLPALSQTPDALFDGLAGTVRTWPRARISVQSRRLFELLAQRTGRGRWLERSGLSHYYLPDLLTGFPKARYVHLTRDGREVILSMMGMRLFDPVVRTAWMMQLFKRGHMRRRIYFRQRALGRRLLLNFVALENVLTRQHRRARPYSLPDRLSEVRRYRVYARFWANTMEMALEAMQEIPSDRLHTMRYEDLVARPRAELERLSEFLEPGVDRSAWIESLAGMPEVRPGRWPRLDPALAAEAEEIIGPVNRLLGYG